MGETVNGWTGMIKTDYHTRDHDLQLIHKLLNRKLIKKNETSYDFLDRYSIDFYSDTFYDQCARVFPSCGAFLMKWKPSFRFSRFQELFGSNTTAGASSYNVFVNVPFCRAQCGFCHYPNTLISGVTPNMINQYLEQCIREINRYFPLLNDKSSIQCVAIGGGTPFLLTVKQLEKLCHSFESKYVLKTALKTIESTPYEVMQESAGDKLSALRACGFKRISLGVQAYDNATLKMIGCRGSSEQNVDAAFDRIRGAGFNHINIDLLCGATGQNEDTAIEKARRLIDQYFPESITLYRYNHAKNSNLIKINSCRFDPFLVFDAMRKYDIFLKEKGYQKYGRHYVYTKQSSLSKEKPICDWLTYRGNWIGIGARSISVIEQTMYKNLSNIHAYMKVIENNSHPVVLLNDIDVAHVMKRFVVGQIIDAKGIDKGSFQEQFNKNFDQVFLNARNELNKMEVCEESNTRFKIKDEYSIFDHEIAKIFVTSRLC